MDRTWENYVKSRLPNISDSDLQKLLEIADTMVIKGTAANKVKAIDALIAVIGGISG